ncbi:MAG: DegT/DnrJ/EryC1/StrS family aminotransferase [Phycisphaerales bacterium]|nr:DegT/DnrJ/EryC1/StrS family aminotransferase [Phycisphaerales bacterium]
MTTTTSSNRPALLGGQPAVTLDQTEALRWPIVTTEDEEAVLRVLRSGEISINDEVSKLEDDYRQWLDLPYAIAHNNGTGGIHGAMHAFDIGPGDEVIVQSATWWASVMPILHQGGIPVFAELDPDTLGLCPKDVEQKITDRTKAIVVVHLFGMPSKMDELMEIASKYGLLVLEDASHAHGATYKGRKIGTIGDAAVFSMQANKLVPSSEGGMFLCSDEEMYEKVLRYGHYERLLGLESLNKYLAATGLGHKFRMSPLSAAVARVQLRHLDERNEKRNHNCIRLGERLEKLGIKAFLAPDDVQRTYFEYLVHYDEEATGLPIGDLATALRAEGAQIEAPRYPLLHQMPVFTHGFWSMIARTDETDSPLREYDIDDLPFTVKGNGSLLKLPAFPNAGDDLVDQYAAAFEKVLSHADEIPRDSE